MIIDAHVHTFPDRIAPKAVGKLAAISGLAPYTDGTVADTLRGMDRAGVDISVCLNIATRPGQEHTINSTAAEVTANSGGRLVAFGSVNPDSPDWREELVRIGELGLKGIKFHPDYQDFTVDEEKMWPLYDALQGTGLMVTFHSGWDCYSPDHIHCFPDAAARMARKFPGTRFCFAHMGGLRLWDQVYEHLVGIPNVYMDTAMAATLGLEPELARKIILEHVPGHIFLGSDCPWEDPAVSVSYVRSLGLAFDVTEGLLWRNAAEAIGINTEIKKAL